MVKTTIRDVIRAAQKFTRGKFRLTYNDIGKSIDEVYPDRFTQQQAEILAAYDITLEKLIWLRAVHREVDLEQINSSIRSTIFVLLDDLNWMALEILKLPPSEYGLDDKVNHFQNELRNYKLFIKQLYK